MLPNKKIQQIGDRNLPIIVAEQYASCNLWNGKHCRYPHNILLLMLTNVSFCQNCVVLLQQWNKEFLHRPGSNWINLLRTIDENYSVLNTIKCRRALQCAFMREYQTLILMNSVHSLWYNWLLWNIIWVW